MVYLNLFTMNIHIGVYFTRLKKIQLIIYNTKEAVGF